jgi:hypothetical protein
LRCFEKGSAVIRGYKEVIIVLRPTAKILLKVLVCESVG